MSAASASPAYSRLPGSSHAWWGVPRFFELVLTLGQVAFIERCRLYQQPDHLLVLCTHGLTETAHRFYFEEIQAITVRRDQQAKFINFALGLFVLAGVGAAFAAADSPFASIALVAVALIAPVCFAVNILRGPTCKTELHTAVYRQRLPNLSRWRSAVQVVEILQPQIQAAQAAEPPAPGEAQAMPDAEDAPESRINWMSGAHTEPRTALRKAASTMTPDTRPIAVFYYLLLLQGLSSMADLIVTWDPKDMAALLVYAGMVVMGCIAVGNHSPALPRVLRALNVASLMFVTCYFIIVMFLITTGIARISDPSPGFSFAIEPPATGAVGFSLIEGFGFPLLAVWGLLLLRRHRRGSTQAHAAPSPET